jgi:hypothetical protein
VTANLATSNPAVVLVITFADGVIIYIGIEVIVSVSVDSVDVAVICVVDVFIERMVDPDRVDTLIN